MKTTWKSCRKGLFPTLLVLVMAMAFTVSCGDPGSDAGQPTGPDSINDPQPDAPRAQTSLKIIPNRVSRAFANSIPDSLTPVARISATYKGADGQAVEGMPINTFIEDPQFYTAPNPSYTNAWGQVSVDILISAAFVGRIASGSYAVAAGTVNPPTEDWTTLYITP